MSKQQDFYQISLKVILKNAQGEMLILETDYGSTFAGFHDLPGGRINKDEFSVPLLEIIKREISEEIGNIDIVINEIPVAIGRHHVKKEHTRSKNDFHLLYVFYEARMNGGDITLSDEHEGFKWIDPEKIELEKYFTSGILEGMKMYLKK